MDARLPEPGSRIHAADESKRTKPRRSRRRVWLFRMAAISLGLLPLLVIEAGLRILGIGADLALVTTWPNSPGWFQLNPRFDEPFYGRGDLSGPETRPFRLPKPTGTRRILVVGGSTVVGFPYTSELAFPRHLQVMLQAQADAGDTIEVLNAGITALNSAAEVAVVAEGLKAAPDVVVVYTGHNEFYGPGGVASSAGWLSPRWYRTITWWRRLYLVQALRRVTTPSNPSTDLIESLPGDLHIAHDGKTFQQAVARFDENLSAMAALAQRARVPIIFVSPVANEHHQPPIEDLRAGQNSVGENSWQEMLRVGERQLLWGDKAKALELLESARAERDHDPLIRFRLAQAYERAGRSDEAVAQFQWALDLDGCRFRAPSAFRSTMAAVASRHATNGAWFVDLHAAICQDDSIVVPGRKHFWEHVHFTWEGNRVVGDAIARCVWQQVWSRPWSTDRSVDEAMVRSRLAVQPEDHLAAHALAMMIYQWSPFREGADAPKLAKELAEDSVFAFQRLPPERSRLFEQLTPTDMASDLIAVLVRKCRLAKQDELLCQWLRVQVVRQPWKLDARIELVAWLRGHGDREEADRLQQSSGDWPGSSVPRKR